MGTHGGSEARLVQQVAYGISHRHPDAADPKGCGLAAEHTAPSTLPTPETALRNRGNWRPLKTSPAPEKRRCKETG